VTQRSGGPTPEELLRLLDQCDISTSYACTPCPSPSPLLMASVISPHRLKAANLVFLSQQQGSAPNSSDSSTDSAQSSNSTQGTKV
jgi:hypothetical protein